MKALNGPAINTHQQKNNNIKWNKMNKFKLCFYLMVDNCFFMTIITLKITGEKKMTIKNKIREFSSI